jgi:hypothetical protein
VLKRNIASLILDNSAIGQGGFGLNRKTNAFFVGQH